MATHYSVLAWRIPGTGEPGGLLSMGSHRVGHDRSDLAAAVAAAAALQYIHRNILGRKVMTNLDHIKKQRHYSDNKGLSSQSYGFSSSHVWM